MAPPAPRRSATVRKLFVPDSNGVILPRVSVGGGGAEKPTVLVVNLDGREVARIVTDQKASNKQGGNVFSR